MRPLAKFSGPADIRRRFPLKPLKRFCQKGERTALRRRVRGLVLLLCAMVHPTECLNKVIADRRDIPPKLYMINQVSRNKLSGVAVADGQAFSSTTLRGLVGAKGTRGSRCKVAVCQKRGAGTLF